MSETRGVFSLEDIIEQKLENEWVPLEDVWLEPPFPGTGYFGGGGYPRTSLMDKVTYSSDTTAAVPGANLTAETSEFAATGNSTHGYFGGGRFPITALMNKVTYASDTTVAVPGANLSAARYFLAATGNSEAGYFGGGSTPATVATMDKVTYSSDTTAAVPGANLSGARSHLAASSSRANALTQPPAPTPTSQVVSSTPVIV